MHRIGSVCVCVCVCGCVCVCVWLGLGYYQAGYELPWTYRIMESDGNQTFVKSGPQVKDTKTLAKQADAIVLPMQQDLAWMG